MLLHFQRLARFKWRYIRKMKKGKSEKKKIFGCSRMSVGRTCMKREGGERERERDRLCREGKDKEIPKKRD